MNQLIKIDMQSGNIFQAMINLSEIPCGFSHDVATPDPNYNGFKIYAIIQTDCFLSLKCTVGIKLVICW